jgi:lactam utilization protein B
MADRSYPAVDKLIRRAQRAAAGRPDAARILAQTISMACPGGADPYAVLGVLIEGTVQTLVEHIPKERQVEIAATLKQLLDQRLKACGVPDGEG